MFLLSYKRTLAIVKRLMKSQILFPLWFSVNLHCGHAVLPDGDD
ncbi:MAG TPA: hypothetical protein VFA77_04945 [Candidatus Eisenbacteria bacterium]|nr:hypothetical protein [Candidatus Eisenbacteria bacterium]